MNKTQKQTVALVNKAWWALPHLSGSGWGDGKEKLFDIGTTDEKAHRRRAPDGWKHSTTVADAARLMAVHDMARALIENKTPRWSDFLSMRTSYLTAAALADVNRKEITKAWVAESVSVEELAALDYAAFVGGEQP